jgi:hypothetical protein
MLADRGVPFRPQRFLEGGCGQGEVLFASLRGFRGPRALQDQGHLPATADTLAARVNAFKQQQGLPADGKALPTTFLLVNRLTGVDEPRLSAP